LSSTKKQSIWFLILAMSAVTLFAACEPGDPGRSTGSYPIDIFQEMHYNQSHKAQEPPRFSPPAGSIPVEGGYIAAPLKADAADLTNPFVANPDALERGALLYKQNCSMCHGLTAGGDGFVGNLFADYPSPQPPAFNSERLRALTSGETYASISNGAGFMPPFQGLLTEQDRWALVALVEADNREQLLDAVNSAYGKNAVGRDEPERTIRLLQLRGMID
jgi:mono/diheme cytochrome c family protein